MDKYTLAFVQAMDATRVRNHEVAKRAGVADNYVSQWRTGRRPIPAGRAPAVADMLGVSPERISEPYERLLLAGCIPREGFSAGSVPSGHLPLDRLLGFEHGDGPSFILLPDFLVRQKIGMTPLEHVRWALQPTGALAPAIPLHTVMLIDARIVDQSLVLDGELYAYSLYGRPHIRRIHVQRDHWVLAGQQSEDRVLVGPEELPALYLHGQVLAWL
jgi:transcriptional regulator with XRE-family HTH domain